MESQSQVDVNDDDDNDNDDDDDDNNNNNNSSDDNKLFFQKYQVSYLFEITITSRFK